MKKVIIIAMLLSILCVCGLSAGVCFADESATYYYVDEGKELSIYSSPQRSSGISMQIPSTYAFKYVKEENNDFAEIEYDGYKGYVLVNDLTAVCKQVGEKWGNNPYAYTFNVSDLGEFAVESIVAYQYNNNVLTEISPTMASITKITAVYGYLKDGGQVYFLVDYHVDIATGLDVSKCYVKATDFVSAPNVNNIPNSAGYVAQTTPEKPSVPSGEINSGSTTPPSLDNNGTDTQTPKNSLDRYILIAVIAVLCVVIIILIFVPNKKRQG